RSCLKRSHSGSRPNACSTRNTSKARPSSLGQASAASTSTPWSASVPAPWQNNPVRSGATTINSGASTSTTTPSPPAAPPRAIAGRALADVAEPSAHEQEVRTRDVAPESRRLGRGLTQMPVNGEAVVGVALRTATDGRPLGQHPHEQVVLVEALEHRDGVGA